MFFLIRKKDQRPERVCVKKTFGQIKYEEFQYRLRSRHSSKFLGVILALLQAFNANAQKTVHFRTFCKKYVKTSFLAFCHYLSFSFRFPLFGVDRTEQGYLGNPQLAQHSYHQEPVAVLGVQKKGPLNPNPLNISQRIIPLIRQYFLSPLLVDQRLSELVSGPPTFYYITLRYRPQDRLRFLKVRYVTLRYRYRYCTVHYVEEAFDFQNFVVSKQFSNAKE